MIIIHLGGLSTGIYELYFHFCFFLEGGLKFVGHSYSPLEWGIFAWCYIPLACGVTSTLTPCHVIYGEGTQHMHSHTPL